VNCTQEAAWTPFETHCFSENVVAQGIEPGPLDLQPVTLTTRPQRRSMYTGHTQRDSAVPKVDTKCISHPTREQHTLSTAGTS
jgi:hypothetical protein